MSNLNTLLFFKIWRNIPLKKKIYSYLINELKYQGLFIDEIVSVEWMCKHGHLDLLKKKVLNKEYLVFETNQFKSDENEQNIQQIGQNNGANQINDINEEDVYMATNLVINSNNNNKNKNYNKYIIFKLINNDLKFYKKLFKCYFKIFISSKEELKETLKHIIKFDCIGALKILKKKCSLKFKEKHFIESIINESFTVSEYIYNKLLIKPNQQQVFLKTIHQRRVDLIKSESIDKRTLFLVKVLNFKVPAELDNLQYLHNSNLLECTLREIYNSCITLALLKRPLAYYVKHLKDYLQSQDNWDFDVMYPSEITRLFFLQDYTWLTIEYLEGIPFTQEQLDTKLMNFDLKSAKRLQDLESILRMVIPFIDILNSTKYMVGFIYYNFVFKDSKLIQNILFSSVFDDFLSFFQRSDMFSIKVKIRYTKYLSELINYGSENSTIYRRYQRRVLSYLISINDTQAIKKALEAMHSCDTKFTNQVFVDIKEDTSLFDFCFTQISKESFNFGHLLSKTNLTILNHYKNNYYDDFKKRVQQLDLSTIQKPYKDHLVLFFYENLTEFCTHFNYIGQIWKPFDQNPNLLEITYQEFKYFITHMEENNLNNYLNIFFKTPSHPNPQNNFNNLEKFLYFKYQSYNILNFILNSKNIIQDNQDDAFEIRDYNNPSLFIKNCKLTLFEIGRRGDTNTLNCIMTSCFPTEFSNLKYKNRIYELLLFSSYFGQIQIFKFLHNNYPWVFHYYKDIKKIHNTVVQSYPNFEDNPNNQIKLSDLNILLNYSKININLFNYLNKIIKIIN
ncbi:hypothetical protein DICPUDRAFT_79783 [Dictyostelium purpureum]|uniref:Uncharacterized protein n=1 Tax=Dictyostelium purpureum TaxID=5786 RepID=F0ZNL8_DICPU|nr:uncharacterized protein DICPUDRAFT_79783 [Dictyostelium purpureum]EGC34479.1 hypothetical protein DICPUDRAFT_79783 [Dictyostelium purpureum]|eukprot:XP_003289014.1 hypothetical protein DICPUDRAFT_79783 [Dictyostelium purpureum]